MKRTYYIFLIAALILPLSACTEAQLAAHVAKQIPFPGDTPKSTGRFKIGNPYVVKGKTYYPRETYSYTQKGIASWYGPNFHGKKTANGEYFDKNELTAAHKTLQLPCLIRVTNLENGRSLILRVNDRGPFSRNRILDVSERAAELLGFKVKGTARIKLQVLERESRQIAQAAKNGVDTSGTEVALNQNKVPHYGSSVQQVSVKQTPPQTTPQGHVSGGRFMPDPVVQQYPVTPSKMYVQAASFTDRGHAIQLSQRLSQIGPSKITEGIVNGKTYYRVRVGPLDSVGSADHVLNKVVNTGFNDALIVVD